MSAEVAYPSEIEPLELLYGPNEPVYPLLDDLRARCRTSYVLAWREKEERRVSIRRAPHLREGIDPSVLLDPVTFGMFLQRFWKRFGGWYALSNVRFEDWMDFHRMIDAKGCSEEAIRGFTGEALLRTMMRLLRDTILETNTNDDTWCLYHAENDPRSAQILSRLTEQEMFALVRGHNVQFRRYTRAALEADDEDEEQAPEPSSWTEEEKIRRSVNSREFDSILSAGTRTQARHYYFDIQVTERSAKVKHAQDARFIASWVRPDLQKICRAFVINVLHYQVPEGMMTRFTDTIHLPHRQIVEDAARLFERHLSPHPVPTQEEYARFRDELDELCYRSLDETRFEPR